MDISIENRTFQLPDYYEIPNVGLYLEQVVKYVNGYIEPLTHTTLTSSMVSNYVKKGLIDNPVKKLYYRDQIGYLIYLSLAKSVISLDDIHILFEIGKETNTSIDTYHVMTVEFKNAIEYVFGEKAELDPILDTYSKERVLLRDTVLAIAHKLYLDSIFEKIHLETDFINAANPE